MIWHSSFLKTKRYSQVIEKSCPSNTKACSGTSTTFWKYCIKTILADIQLKMAYSSQMFVLFRSTLTSLVFYPLERCQVRFFSTKTLYRVFRGTLGTLGITEYMQLECA